MKEIAKRKQKNCIKLVLKSNLPLHRNFSQTLINHKEHDGVTLQWRNLRDTTSIKDSK